MSSRFVAVSLILLAVLGVASGVISTAPSLDPVETGPTILDPARLPGGGGVWGGNPLEKHFAHTDDIECVERYYGTTLLQEMCGP